MGLDKGSIVVLGMNINRFGTGVTRLGNNFGTSARGASLNEIVTTGGWRCAHKWQQWCIRLITVWTTATWGMHIYCTDTFRRGHSSILVVGDHRGLIG